MKPKSIRKEAGDGLRITWENGHQSLYPLTFLRDACPCASCAGETVLFRTYTPPPPDLSTPGRYELVDIRLVGSYAAQLYWADGHETGIYSWERLLTICPCPEHSGGTGA
jgi:DUF971 family protein